MKYIRVKEVSLDDACIGCIFRDPSMEPKDTCPLMYDAHDKCKDSIFIRPEDTDKYLVSITTLKLKGQS